LQGIPSSLSTRPPYDSFGQWNAVRRWFGAGKCENGANERDPGRSPNFWSLSMAFVSWRAKTFLIKWQRRVAGIR